MEAAKVPTYVPYTKYTKQGTFPVMVSTLGTVVAQSHNNACRRELIQAQVKVVIATLRSQSDWPCDAASMQRSNCRPAACTTRSLNDVSLVGFRLH